MATAVYITGFFAIIIVGYLVAEDPDNLALRLMLYAVGFVLMAVLIYKYLGSFFGWHDGEDDVPAAPPRPAPESVKKKPPVAEPASPPVIVTKLTTAEIKALMPRTLAEIQGDTPPEIRAEITDNIRRAQNEDPDMACNFGRAVLFGDAYLKVNMELATAWLSHAAAQGVENATFLLDWARDSIAKGKPPKMPNKPLSYVSKAAPLSLIDNMIGLDDVKKQVKTLLNRRALEEMRKKNDLPSVDNFNLHLVFTGNPGTGKTMVAQRIGAILAATGILKMGHIVEVSGAELVGEFIGTTGPKIEAAVQSAIGGILFIDEAYALISHIGQRGPENSASMTAITTLLMQMDKNKGNFMVIVAGYPDEMRSFLSFNPGLKSRFREVLHFPNFSAEELVKIFEKIADDRHYVLAAGSKAVLDKIMRAAPGKYAKSFGNARFVGNLFEETLERVANRVAQSANPSREDLMTITPFDINDAAEDFTRQHNR
ncbi:MAG: AAA family ATPase [Alphaproteobacteria bacterium]